MDEGETILNLRACEVILIVLVDKHGGRLFNTGGDFFRTDFFSGHYGQVGISYWDQFWRCG